MTRAAQKAKTRAKLLDVATTLFEQQGFEQTTIRAIAQEAGVSVGAVFVHFQDKEDLLYSAFYTDLQHITERTIDTVPMHTSIARQLRYIAASFYGTYAQRPALYRTLLERVSLANGTWRARFDAQTKEVTQKVTTLFQESQSRGECHHDIDCDVAAHAFMAFYDYILAALTRSDFADQVQMIDQLDALIAQHLSGLAP